MIKKRGKKTRRELIDGNFKVTIFGSARIKKGDAIYKQIKILAKMLGERNMDVITGGGPGLMKAASEGHRIGKKNKKAHTIGLAIRLWNEQKTNKYVDIEKKFLRFSNRLDNFMLLSNAIVVAPGGVGTLLEFFYSWQLVQTKQICNIPIILLGKQWKDLVKWLEKYPLKKRLLEEKDLKLLFLVNNCNEAIEIIDEAHESYKKGGENFCLNYEKYRLK